MSRYIMITGDKINEGLGFKPWAEYRGWRHWQSHNQGSMQIFNESIIPYLNVMFYWGINPVRSRGSSVWQFWGYPHHIWGFWLVIGHVSDPILASDWPMMTTGPRPPGVNTDRDEELLMLPPVLPALSNRLCSINHWFTQGASHDTADLFY